jgi:hypothetical protein
MTRYFRMRDDVHVPGRWFLTEPRDRHGAGLEWVLGKGRPIDVATPVVLAVSDASTGGRPVDYSELDTSSVPVVHARVAQVFREFSPSDVQVLPARIEGQVEQFFIVNVTRVLDCIDERGSRHVERYTDEDATLFADRIGEYKDVRGMRIDPTKVGGARVFRTWGWVAIVVAEEIKQALERIGTEGVRFQEV